MNRPLVSVVALCYNHSRYVVETLESIQQQSYTNVEVIVFDDCSKDNSVAVVESFLQGNNLSWSFIKHQQNRGIAKTLNEAIDLAKGTYIKFIACDDVLLPDCIETLTTALDLQPQEFAMAYADVITIDENSTVFGETPFAERGWLQDADVPSGNLFIQLAQLCFIPATATLIRRQVLQQLQFDEKLYFEDWDMWLRISKQYLIKGLCKPVVKYRIHRSSMYQAKSPAYQDAELRTVKKHIGFNKEADSYLKDFIYKKSISLYMHGGLRPLYWLWQRFLIHKSLKNFFHVLVALGGISYQKKAKWKKRVKQVLSIS
ncbi:MAG: glycosyltransferase family 2 protein [Lacibacter sp.]